MAKVMDLVTEVTELMAVLQNKIKDLDKKMSKLEARTDKNEKNMTKFEDIVLTQKISLSDKIDKISDQMTELKKIVYETGLLVIGPEKIAKLEKQLDEKKKQAKAKKASKKK